MDEFLQCDGGLEQVTGFIFCRTANATILTESDLVALQNTPVVSQQDAYLISGVIFACCLTAWGFRLALSQLNLKV